MHILYIRFIQGQSLVAIHNDNGQKSYNRIVHESYVRIYELKHFKL